jgi:DNA-binding transcriptional LysR family regulator
MALVKAGVGYAVVPEWMAPIGTSDVVARDLDELQRVKVYFGCSAFLTDDPFMLDMRETCRRRMNAEFSRAAERDGE